jgi:thiol-disulfide isomerase/thioredoxin
MSIPTLARLFLLGSAVAFLAGAIPAQEASPPAEPKAAANSKKIPSEQDDLQKAIEQAGNDRAALVAQLETFLKKYPESQQRPQIYRALVESLLQLRDYSRATEYSERLVALRPEDPSIGILSIRLLERYGDTAGSRRAISYCTRLMDQVGRLPAEGKSPRETAEKFESEKKRDQAALLLTRGRLYKKVNDLPSAQNDFTASYALVPSSPAAERLAELAELRKDSATALEQYARAFALADSTGGDSSRAELRKKAGNTWRRSHSSDEGLGEYLLHVYDQIAASALPPKPLRNAKLADAFEFTLRKAPEGQPFPLAAVKGKLVVLNFWATWCGPCREMEPHFEKVAAHFAANNDILFFALDCDEDESLVAPYLLEEKPKTTVLFADGLDRLLQVDSFPTTVILDHTGKIAFRTDGFDPDTVERTLIDAINRILQPQAASL